MTLARFRAQNHPQQVEPSRQTLWEVEEGGPRDDVDDRGTDPDLFASLNERFGFTVDVAAAAHNAKCGRYFDRAMDGLKQSWRGETVWCNPPYSDIRPWVVKAADEANGYVGRAGSFATIVMLLPANRTEQSWWQDLVEPVRDRGNKRLRVEFLRGRRRFVLPGNEGIGANERPPFGSVLLIWNEKA